MVPIARVLVVDDSSTMRRIVKNSLKSVGYDNVVEAENGEGALARLQAEKVDLVVTDWNMPVMNGLEFLKELRGNLAGGTGPVVVFCTTENDIKHIQEAIGAGANEYIMKPFDSEILETKFAQTGLL